jgi:CheY-like chemotaxis protein
MEGESLLGIHPETGHRESRMPTILLVDDHPSIRRMLSAGLKAYGFHVLTAGTAEKALAYCEGLTDPIDLLLTDIGLTPQELWSDSDCDESISHGLALAEHAIRIRPTLHVVLFTGYSDECLKRLGASLERFRLLRKPCDLATLATTVRQLLVKDSACPRRVPEDLR